MVQLSTLLPKRWVFFWWKWWIVCGFFVHCIKTFTHYHTLKCLQVLWSIQPYWPWNTHQTLHKKTNGHRTMPDFDAQMSQYPCSCHSVHIGSAVNNGAITISWSNSNLNSLRGVKIIGYLIYGTVLNTQIMQGLPQLIIQLWVSLLLELDLL